MTTVLDRPTDVVQFDPPDLDPGESWTGAAVAEWLLAALLAGAGAVHLAMAPSHFGESTIEGLGFLVAGWLQIGLAVAVALRPSRNVTIAVIAVSAASIAAWVVSRTAGLPFGAHAGHPESITIVDGVTVAMEAASLMIAASFLGGSARRLHSNALAFVAVAGVVLLTSAIIASPEARNHSAASHHDDGHLATGAGASDGHDHEATPAAAASDDAAAAAPADGHQHATTLNGEEVTGVKAQDIAHEEEPDQPLDPATRDQLKAELTTARDLALQYPTVADAKAAGYFLAGGFAPGSGAHYVGGGGGYSLGGFDATKPISLIYDGSSDTSQIIGLMYYGMSEEAPEGFAGPNDHWHRHSGVCTRPGNGKLDVVFPADADVTKQMCDDQGGMYMNTTGWMVHAWVVPSWESPLGVFSHDNPNVRCADGTYDTDDVGLCQGT